MKPSNFCLFKKDRNKANSAQQLKSHCGVGSSGEAPALVFHTSPGADQAPVVWCGTCPGATQATGSADTTGVDRKNCSNTFKIERNTNWCGKKIARTK